jgi:hypothetical protein
MAMGRWTGSEPYAVTTDCWLLHSPAGPTPAERWQLPLGHVLSLNRAASDGTPLPHDIGYD